MKLTILGSGTAAARLERNMSGYLLEAGNKKILFDSGAGTIRQLLKLKVSLLEIDDIFYTHMHPDHINELGAIILCNSWTQLNGSFRKNPLNLFGPKGFAKYYKKLMRLPNQPKPKYQIQVKEMWNDSIVDIQTDDKNTKKNSIIVKKEKPDGNDIRITSIKSMHTDASVSYRVEYNGKVIVYSGDTDYSDEIIKISKNADVLILECSWPDDEKKDGHLTPSLCGKIAAKANAKKLILTHFYPEVDKMDAKKHCSKEFDGEIILARDFMEIVLK